MNTYMAKAKEVNRKWYLIDADGKPLGRLASGVAQILRGKHKPIFTPHVDVGDHVIIINAAKVHLTGNKLAQKKLYRHSGYPGGLKEMNYQTLLDRFPERAVYKAVKGMLPRNRMGRAQLLKLKIYTGTEHKHENFNPKPLPGFEN